MFKRIIKNKRIIIGLTIIILSFLLTIPYRENSLEVSFFDVGQGDSALIEVNDKNILIDGGPDNIVLRRLGESLSFFDRRIDIIILSHYHDDHLTGLIEVLKRYQVDKVIYLKNSPSSLVFESFLKTIKSKNIDFLALDNIIDIDLGDNCFLNLISPNILDVPKNGNNSIIAKLDCFEKKFLFSGDNEYKVEKALLNSGLDLEVDIFKASHHGSKTSNREDFLQAISPNQVIVSSGKDNRFNHPSDEVIERLDDLGIEIYRTDQQGTIRIIE